MSFARGPAAVVCAPAGCGFSYFWIGPASQAGSKPHDFSQPQLFSQPQPPKPLNQPAKQPPHPRWQRSLQPQPRWQRLRHPRSQPQAFSYPQLGAASQVGAGAAQVGTAFAQPMSQHPRPQRLRWQRSLQQRSRWQPRSQPQPLS